MQHLRSIITGTGSYLPEKIVTNSEIALKVNSSAEWIEDKIGIKERRFVSLSQGPSDLALKASQRALEASQKKAKDIDCILFATTTPDYEAPGSGVLLQDKLGCRKIPAFDIRNTSPGFLFALELGDQLIRSGKYQCILIAASEVFSPCLDYSERGRLMTVIFGDGAGSVILEPTESPHGILRTKLHSDGSFFDKLWCEAPSTKKNPYLSTQMINDGLIHPTMDGRIVFENAVRLMSLVCEEVIVEENFEVDDITHVIPHQANLKIIKEIASQLKVPMEKVCLTIEKYGNTSAASIPITLDECVKSGKIKKNDVLLTTSFGSGFSWGAGLIRW